jgi:hypothetical protein
MIGTAPDDAPTPRRPASFAAASIAKAARTWTSKRFSAISLPPAVVTDANVVLSALIKVFTTGDLLDALRDAGHDPDLA